MKTTRTTANTISDLEYKVSDMNEWKRNVLTTLIQHEEDELANRLFTQIEIIEHKLKVRIPLDELETRAVLNQLNR